MHVVAPPAPTPPSRDSPGWKRYEPILDALRARGAAYAVSQIERLTPEVEDGRLILSTADPFFGDWVQEHYLELMRSAEAQGPPLELRYPPKPTEALA